PEHEQIILSLSHTPALRAITPTKVSESSIRKGPSLLLDTTMLLPISSQTATGRPRRTFPFPFSSTSTAPNKPLGKSVAWAWGFELSQMPPVEAGPCVMSPASRTVAQYLPVD